MAGITLKNPKVRHYYALFIALMCEFLCNLVVCAQKAAPDSTMRNHELAQVVVTGTGTHSRAQNAVVPVQVITAEELQRMHVTSLEDALKQLTSSVTTMTNGMGTTMMMNGLNEDYILILENGKRLTGDDRYTRINMANVKRIEVLSGASSALYGSEAIGGVINIITTDNTFPSITDGDREWAVDVQSSTSYTSKGRFINSFAVNARKGNFNSSTSFQHRQADNWQVNQTEEVMGKLMPTGRVMSQAFHSNQLNQRFSWDIGHGVTFYVKGSFYDYRTNRPQMARYYKGATKKNSEGGNDTVFTEREAYSYDLHHQDYMYGTGATWKINSKAYLEADFYSDNLMSERDSFDNVRPGGTQLTKRTHYYNGMLKGIFRLGSWNKLSAGVEYVHETYESYNFAFRTMYTLSLFAQDEMRISKNLQGVLGIRYIHNRMFGSYATPSVSVMYSPGRFRLRAGYSTGYRTPTLLQMYYENDETKNITIGNQDLKPEKSNYYNVSAEYNNSWVSLKVGAFINDVRDMISYRVLTDEEVVKSGLDTKYPTATKYQQRDNIDKAKVKGLHLTATFYLPQNIRLGGAYTFTDTKAETLQLNAKTQQYEVVSEPTDRSMRHTGRVFVGWGRTWGNYRLNIDLNGHLQSRRWSTSYGWAPGYTQFDLHTTHTFYLKHVELIPGLGIENIFNTRDTRPWNSNFSTLHPGRCVLATFKIHVK
ncbi:MAG: TonB-dependent receptor [Bacteroidaceae bacterium]|nr:TonB-dependent receptor [Bacteroidaceae bacterium]